MHSCYMLYTLPSLFFFFFFNDTATTEIYTLSLHDALPISHGCKRCALFRLVQRSNKYSERDRCGFHGRHGFGNEWSLCHGRKRSEEHTSELQSPCNLVCRLLLEKKKITEFIHSIVLPSHYL